MAKREFGPWGKWLARTVICGSALFALETRADIPPGPRPIEQPQPDAQKPAPEKATRLATKKAQWLEDGLYIGPLVSENTTGEIQMTVVRGFIVEAFIRRTGEGLVPFDLNSIGVSNAAGIQLQGSQGNEFVRVNGEIIDAERGRGTFDGVLVRRQTSGTWSVTRR